MSSRIKVGIAILCIIGMLGLYKMHTLIKGQENAKVTATSSPHKEVEGVSTEEHPSSESVDAIRTVVQETVQDKVTTLVKEAQQISIPEIASSSPQVQKILQDLKSLEEYPRSQAKEACQKICANF